MNSLFHPWKRCSCLHWAILLICAALTGCNRNEIKVYRVAKEQSASPPMPAQATMPAAVSPGHPDIGGAALPQLTWKLPAGWEEQTPGEMRVASFSVKDQNGKQADVSVIPLPGAAGGELANVNRWRGQVGLKPVPEDELKKLAQKVEVGAQPAEFYEQSGKSPGSGDDSRILAVILHREGMAWFFKMTGDDRLVEEQKPAFVEFLKSFRFATPEMAALPPSHPPIDGASLPAGHADRSGTPAPMAAAAVSNGGQPDWQVPAGWQETAGGQFLIAKFLVTGDGGAQAAVNVSASPGDGGGLVPNLNRWRKQVGLAELSGSEETNALVKPVEIPGGKALLVDMNGTDGRTGEPARLVAVMVPHGDQTWFYKLMGDAKVVESQKEAFMKFVRTVRY